MTITRVFKNVVSAFPLIGAHAQKEVELLLSGIKPIGVFDYRRSSDCMEHQVFREYILQQILPLEEAVQRGQLNSIIVHQRNQTEGYETTFQLYCQPGNDEKMKRLARFFQSPGPETHLSDEEVGISLGYSKKDVWLFKRGGYASLPFGLSWLASATHDYRKKCRIEAELQSAASSKIKPEIPDCSSLS